MCGIAGILTREEQPGNEDLVAGMLDSLRHRGPDDRGIFRDPGTGSVLGACRLSILDLSAAGRQPMATPDGNLVLVYNGEVYNYREIREELARAGVAFSTGTDTEVVLKAWDRWGGNSLLRFNGMFAFCLLDRSRRKAFLVRDRLGVKPCFYREEPERLIFASEAKAFYRLPERIWSPRESSQALRSLLAFQFLASPGATVFSNLSRVPPGHLLECDLGRGKTVLRRWWRLRGEAAPDDFEAAAVRTRELLESSVRLRLRADVPVGILLSALAARAQPVRTFTAGFRHRLDERPYARMAAQAIGAEHHEVELDPAEIGSRIEEVIPVFDALTSLDAGILTIYFILEKLREFRVKVLLVGEGADEVFGGYSWFRHGRPPLAWLPLSLRARLHHYAVSRMLKGTDASARELADSYREGGDPDAFRQVSRWEIETQLPSNYLMKVDHATMAHSVEARVPYLDHRLVEFAFGLPPEWKTGVRGGRNKLVLRRLGRDLLPAALASRPKLAFPLSMAELLRSNRDKVLDCLLAEGSLARENLPQKRIEALADFRPRKYSPLEKEKEFLLWKLFLIEVWRGWVRRERAEAAGRE